MHAGANYTAQGVHIYGFYAFAVKFFISVVRCTALTEFVPLLTLKNSVRTDLGPYMQIVRLSTVPLFFSFFFSLSS